MAAPPPPASGRTRGPATFVHNLPRVQRIDRHLALFRTESYRHFRTQPGRRIPLAEWKAERLKNVASVGRAAAWPSWKTQLVREWKYLVQAVTAVVLGETIRFRIGGTFVLGEQRWVCTDVGTRTICAVLLDDLIESGDSEPPYSIVEYVLDRYAMDGVEPE